MNLTFIEAASGTPLVKKFTQDKTIPYPNVAAINSYEYEVTPDDKGLKDFYDLLQANSPKGWAMLRGPLLKELSNESRKGQHDKSALTQRLTLDFDGIDTDVVRYIQHNADGVRTVAEHLLAELPEDFSDVSYIASASSSFGTRDGSVSLHVELFLDGEVSPVELKRYLQQLNFDCPFLRERLSLSSNALALRWPLDVSVADNSKIIFIGTPVFDGVKNPFEKDEDRVIFVQKQEATFNSAVIRAVNGADIRVAQNDLIKELRRSAGMRAKTPRLKQVSLGGEPVEVLTNPEEVEIKIDVDEGDYIRANVNGGDSGAYWWPKANPEYVFNFKGEPAFKMKDAAPVFYHQYKDTYRDFILQSAGLDAGDIPIVFREPSEDEYYSMIYNRDSDEIKRFARISLPSVENFMATWGVDKPQVFPEYDLIFDPTTNTQFDEAKRFVNKFRPTKYLKQFDLPAGAKQTRYGTCAKTVEKYAPSFFTNIKHVLGNSDEETEHFLNWLAYIVQKREKSGTAWILIGTTGTGKGLLFNALIRRLFGEYAKTATTSTIDDDKNGFLEDCLFLFVDEFKESDSHNSSRVHNTLKNMITEKHMTIRHMRQTAKTVRNYTNFMFSANYNDIMTITDDDRRFNVGTRQEQSLRVAYPQLPVEIDDEDQLMKFAAILNTHIINEQKVQELIDNASRRTVQTASMNIMQRFWHAVSMGELDHFIEHIVYAKADHEHMIVKLNAAKTIVLNWASQAVSEPDEEHFVEVEDLRNMYNVLSGKRDPVPSQKWSQIIERQGLKPERARLMNGRRPTCVKIKWKSLSFDLSELVSAESSANVESIDTHRKKSRANV